MEFVGVDLETSGIDHKKSVPIQFGLAFKTDPLYYDWDIGGWDWDEWEWNEESAKIHCISKHRLSTAPDAETVDRDIANFLSQRKHDGERFCMVGWNVSGFDRPFIERHLPKTFDMFSYRTVDLNAICFALAVPYKRSYDTLKRHSKQYALDQMSPLHEELWHDAGFDALASLHSYEWLRGVAQQGLEQQ